MNNEEKSENAVDTKQNADGTKQKNKREKVCAVSYMNNEEKKKRKHGRLVEQIADDMKRIADGTKQNKKRQKVYAVPRGSQFCKSGLGILRKGEVIP
ncbi:hypothetical protein T02_307 [Trichinella nativa]|uniref:Uncharacterized protein n=4 Tax=Trichinella TaxID=6333 RepID=A0A0V1KJU2_9BILA|nr:hypothetical protein T02_307 [Trichinella nativa]